MRGAVEPLSRRASIRTQSLSGSVPAWCPKGSGAAISQARPTCPKAGDPEGRRSHQDPANSSSHTTSRIDRHPGGQAAAWSTPPGSLDLKG